MPIVSVQILRTTLAISWLLHDSEVEPRMSAITRLVLGYSTTTRNFTGQREKNGHRDSGTVKGQVGKKT